MSTLTCEIVTPVAKLFSEEAYMVVVPGADGEMGFLEGHAPLVSALADGSVRVMSDATTTSHCYALQGGYVQVTGKKVIVLADRAVLVDDIDVEAVKQREAELSDQLAGMDDSDAEKAIVELELDWCRVQQHVVANKAA